MRDICWNKTDRLQLGLGRSKSRDQKVAHVTSSLVEVVAHAVGTETLGNNVEVDAVLVDHVGDSEAAVNDLAPSVTVEELGAQLGGGDVPRAGVAVGGVGVDGGDVLAGLEEFFKTEQVAVDTLAVRGGGDVLDVGLDGLVEELDLGLVVDGGVDHSLAPGVGVLGQGAGGFGTAELEATGGGGFVCGTVLAVHLEVGVLDEHLDVGVGRALELLDQALAVALVGLDGELVLADERLEIQHGAVNVLLHLGGDFELDERGVRQVRADRGVREIDFVVEDEVVDVVVEAVGGCSVHHGVLAHEARGAIVVDDELQGLVVPAVGTVAVPVGVGALLEGDGRGIVKADDEGGRLNRLEGGLVLSAGIEEGLAGIGPDVTVLRGQSADGRDRLSVLVDAAELLLEFRGVELLAVELVQNLVELVLANDNDVLVVLVRELDGVVGGLGGNTAGVEHPLVAVHADGELLHVLGLKRAAIDHLLELQDGGSNGGGALGGVAALAVIAVGVEVADVRDDRIAVGQVSSVVPPLVDPVLGLGVLGLGDELLLELAADAAGLDKVGDGSLGVLEFLGGQQRAQGLEVSGGSLLESRDGKAGKRLLESQHVTFGLVLFVAYTSGFALERGSAREGEQAISEEETYPQAECCCFVS